MKHILSALLLVVVLAGSAFGLSDKEYLRMKSSSKEFREADEFLTECYDECRDTLPPAKFRQIQQEQREWVKSGRDEQAGWFMEKGYSRIEAYTKATEMRADDLHQICVIYRNANYRNEN